MCVRVRNGESDGKWKSSCHVRPFVWVPALLSSRGSVSSNSRCSVVIVVGGAKLAGGSVFIETRPFRQVSDSLFFFTTLPPSRGTPNGSLDDEKKKSKNKEEEGKNLCLEYLGFSS